VFAALSLGNHVVVGGRQTGIPAPFRLLARFPVVDMALPTRFSLILAPILAALLALAGDRLLRTSQGEALFGDGARLPIRWLALGTAAMALVPLVPVPLPAFEPPPVPAFISAGTWRTYVPDGRSVVPVPLPRFDAMAGMRWAAATNGDLPLPRGFFIGPDGTLAHKGAFEPPAQPTASLLAAVARTGEVPVLGPAQQRDAVADLRVWRAAIVVLANGQRHADALRATVQSLLGPGRYIGGVWVWDVRSLVG
jgi:hypothetical protein